MPGSLDLQPAGFGEVEQREVVDVVAFVAAQRGRGRVRASKIPR